MKLVARIALAALLIVAAACHKKDSKEAQLKALDEAYKSGVFTKEEYDAKKQALVGTPAPAPASPAAAAAPAPADATPSAPAPDQNPPAGALPDPNAAVPPPDTAPPAVSAPPAAAPPASSPPASAPPAAAPPAAAPPGRRPRSAAPDQTLPPPAPAQPAPAYSPPAAPQAVPATPSAPASGESEPAPLKGCPDAEARAGGPSGVQERFFPASEDAVRAAALQAFTNLDFTIHNSTAHEIEASKKGRLNTVVGAGTEKVILRFESTSSNGQNGTKVVGETKRGIMGRVTQKPWTGAVLAQIACNLRGGR
jgi:hypothetical protein